jgi:ADP-ribose pyrophosphatase
MADSQPSPLIVARNFSRISPWVEIVTRTVEFSPNSEQQIYHAVKTADYVNILAVTTSGQIPLVRQYRPAIEDFTFELPAGMLEVGEDPKATAIRELLEETGFQAIDVHALGTYATDSGRLSNQTHSFFINAGDRIPGFRPEDGIEVRLVNSAELIGMIMRQEFIVQGHLGTILQAALAGYFDLTH